MANYNYANLAIDLEIDEVLAMMGVSLIGFANVIPVAIGALNYKSAPDR